MNLLKRSRTSSTKHDCGDSVAQGRDSVAGSHGSFAGRFLFFDTGSFAPRMRASVGDRRPCLLLKPRRSAPSRASSPSKPVDGSSSKPLAAETEGLQLLMSLTRRLTGWASCVVILSSSTLQAAPKAGQFVAGM